MFGDLSILSIYIMKKSKLNSKVITEFCMLQTLTKSIKVCAAGSKQPTNQSYFRPILMLIGPFIALIIFKQYPV